MKKLDRREFLKLTGIFAGTISLGILPSCSSKKDYTEQISMNELKQYHLITTEDKHNPVMLVKYNKLQGYLVVIMLNTKNDAIIEVEIARELNNNREKAIEDFYQCYSVTSDNLAIAEFDKHFGLKDYYTIDEINYVLEVYQIEAENTKTIIKNIKKSL